MDTLNIKKYFYQILSIFAALLLAFSIAQIPVQAAAKPGTVKLSSIKAVDYNKINIKWKKTSGLQTISYTTKRLVARSGLK